LKEKGIDSAMVLKTGLIIQPLMIFKFYTILISYYHHHQLFHLFYIVQWQFFFMLHKLNC